MVWEMTSCRWLSDLHIIPRDQTVIADSFVKELLKKTATSATRRKTETGPKSRSNPPSRSKSFPRSNSLQISLPDISEAVFQQYGAPAHWTKKTQEWCRTNFPDFWAKDECPGHSPDLSSIENLCAFVQQKLNQTVPATSEDTLTRNLRAAWSCIDAETLDNLVSGMTDRMRACLKERGGHICK